MQNFIEKLTIVNLKEKPLDPSLRKSLQDDLKKEIDELGLMLKKDLSYWYKIRKNKISKLNF